MTATVRIKLDPDYDIVSAGLGYELQFKEPARLQWVCLYEAPTIALCEKAYMLIQEGEMPPCWEEME